MLVLVQLRNFPVGDVVSDSEYRLVTRTFYQCLGALDEGL